MLFLSSSHSSLYSKSIKLNLNYLRDEWGDSEIVPPHFFSNQAIPSRLYVITMFILHGHVLRKISHICVLYESPATLNTVYLTYMTLQWLQLSILCKEHLHIFTFDHFVFHFWSLCWGKMMKETDKMSSAQRILCNQPIFCCLEASWSWYTSRICYDIWHTSWYTSRICHNIWCTS